MKRLAFVDRNICVACGVCAGTCPKGAVSVYRGCYAVVEAEKCIGCGLCARVCPADCIRLTERGEVN